MIPTSRHQLISYFPCIDDGDGAPGTSLNAIDVVVEPPKGGVALATDSDVFLSKLNGAIQNSVATRMEWMNENMGENVEPHA